MRYLQDMKPFSSQHLLAWITMPVIYSVFFPVVLLDLFVEIYHRICFPIYGIPLVKRSDYIKIDRHKLSYLSLVQKIACAYCGYVNGFLAYAVAVAGETEKYWCSIRHEEMKNFKTPKHHAKFIPFDDEKSFKEFTEKKTYKD